MSDTVLNQDPFVPNALDEQTELRALRRTLQMADGFALIFVRCSQSQMRKRLIESLRSGPPPIDLQEIDFVEPITNLLDELRRRIPAPPPEAVSISGLEFSLPSASEAHLTPIVANLNAARNSFPSLIRCPMLLWLSDYAIAAIALGAPDFFSIRSGTYYFVATPTETVPIASSLTGGDEMSARSLSASEKQERIHAIETLLSDYEALTETQRDYSTEARLHARLGALLSSVSKDDEALKHFNHAAKLGQQLQDSFLEATAMHGAGIAYHNQGKLSEAETAFRRALSLDQQSGNRRAEAVALNSLGGVYFLQERLSDAEDAFHKSVAILRENNDSHNEVLALGNLGRIYVNQKRWEEAEQAFKRTLETVQSVGDRNNEVSVRYNLGNLYRSLGRFSEAEAEFGQAASIAREVGNRISEGGSLLALAVLLVARGSFNEALALGERAKLLLQAAASPAVSEYAKHILEDIKRRAIAHEAPAKPVD